MMNDRVKGSLKVTRAFGAGFLKQVSSYKHILMVVENVVDIYKIKHC